MDSRRDQALEYLYGREYDGRGVRKESAGSLDPSQVTLVNWLSEVRELFPQDTVEIIERHALERYGLTELVTDPKTLERLEPNQQLLRTLLTLNGHLNGQVIEVARRIIRQVIEEITAQARTRSAPDPVRPPEPLSPLATGRRQKLRRGRHDTSQSQTLRRRTPQADRRGAAFLRTQFATIAVAHRVVHRSERQHGDSVIHSAVMAGILAGLPAFRVKIVVFDTQVVDLSDHADDPVEILMKVQLGGGTHIAQAVRYCSQIIENPQRTIFVLVTDFLRGRTAR